MTIRVAMRSSVVLPQPLGPTMHTNVPGSIERLTSRRTLSFSVPRVNVLFSDRKSSDAGSAARSAPSAFGAPSFVASGIVSCRRQRCLWPSARHP